MKASARVTVAALAVMLTAAAGCAAPSRLSWPSDGTEQSWSSLPPGLLPQGKGIPVGLYETGFPRTVAPMSSFTAATGVHPRVAVYYSGWNEPFARGFADAARARGAAPLVQIQPDNVPLGDITAGHWDNYLRTYAAAVKAYGHPVILSFAHEMNGTWYSWGSGHATPAAFVAAWRHVVTAFRQARAANVTWLWSVTAITGSTIKGPWLGQWWPGAEWAGLVGIDGYYYSASDTFTSVFGPTVTQLRTFTSDPVVISEVGIGPNSSRESQISGLFAGMRTDHIDAVVWFDVNQHDGIYHQDWRLEGDPAAVAAFQAATK